MKQKAFILKRSKDAWGHIDFMKNQEGAIHVPFEGDDYIRLNTMDIKIVDFPFQICFASDFSIIPMIDYPHNDLNLDILSQKMLSVFKDLDDFKYNEIPVIMFDHKEMEAYHIEQGELLEDLQRRNEDYIAIQLLDYTDVFDRENSEYEEDFLDPDEVGDIDKLVLKWPKKGFPPLFRLDESATKLFVSEQAKNALEAANIKGCEFEEVEVSG
ncbi:hypothetical protein AWE51_02360 [Aquimarina aggregata]|uniref:Immunity MXAN-0049 protein domain-containing protein n=1 Tax=Aquimarina aggregata TaxID=1642818 RepID=A0A163CDP7_9FLAO|nr:hypothetical protein AWE51_02360 [Aquimarina aggregata]